MGDDFIPDSQFVPDSTPAAPAAAPSFVPDSDFVSDEDKYGSLGQQAIAGLEGLARGATLGTSDAAETRLLGVPAADIRGRMDANPWTSNIGQVAGGVGLIAGTGGIAAPAEEMLGGGALARIAGMGVEGGAFGAGNAVSDQALSDHDLTAQQVMADVGMGAALGGGLGALSKGVEAALPAVTRKLGNSLAALREMAIGTAEEPSALVKAASIPGSVASGMSPADWTKALYEGMSRPDSDVTVRGLIKNLQDIHGAGLQAAKDLYETVAPANIGKALESMPVEDAKAIGNDLLNKVDASIMRPGDNGELVSALSSPSSQKIVSDRLGELAVKINNAESAEAVHSALDRFAKDTSKLIKFDTLPTATQMQDQEVLRGIREVVRGNLANENVWGEAANHYEQAAHAYSDYMAARKNFQSAFMKKETGPSGMKRFTVDPGKVKAFFSRIGDPSQDLKAQYLNRFLNETESLAKASENYHGFVKGEKALSEHLSELAKEHSELKGAAQSLRNKVASGQGLASHLFRDMGIGWGMHALGVPKPAVEAGIGMLEAYNAIKNPYQAGYNLRNTVQKLQMMGDIADRVSGKISSLAKNIVTGAPARAATSPASSRLVPSFASNRDYEKKTERIAEFMTNPNKLMEHLYGSTAAIYDASPGVAGAAHATMIRAAQFLDSKIPAPKTQMPLSAKWVPAKSQIAQFSRYYQAVDDPISVMHDIKTGELCRDKLEALSAVHPKLYEQMKSAVIEHLNPETARELPYKTRLAISRFIGQPLEQGMLPQSIAISQASIARAAQEHAAAHAPAAKPSKTGIAKLTLAQRMSLTPNRNDE